MSSIKQGNRNTINLLQKNVSHTRPTTIQNTSNQQITTLLPKKNHQKRGSYNLTAVFGLIKILIDQLASPSQKEKGETLNGSQKRSSGFTKDPSIHQANRFTQKNHFLPQYSPFPQSSQHYEAGKKLSAIQQTAFNVDNTEHVEDKSTTAHQAFEINKKKWRQSGIKNYFYTFQRSCFCTRDATREVLTHVRNGSAVTSQFKDSGEPLPESLNLNKLSINDLFTTIETALDKNVDVIKVRYDNKTGQPTSIYIDGKTGITDDEFSLIAKGLTI